MLQIGGQFFLPGDRHRPPGDVQTVGPQPIDLKRFHLVRIELFEDLIGQDQGADHVESQHLDGVMRRLDSIGKPEEGRIGDLKNLRRHPDIPGNDFRHLVDRGFRRLQFCGQLAVHPGQHGKGVDSGDHRLQVLAG